MSAAVIALVSCVVVVVVLAVVVVVMPRVVDPVERCGSCDRPFDPADPRFDGRARYQGTPFCGGCVDRCHESTDAFHQCAVCR